MFLIRYHLSLWSVSVILLYKCMVYSSFTSGQLNLAVSVMVRPPIRLDLSTHVLQMHYLLLASTRHVRSAEQGILRVPFARTSTIQILAFSVVGSLVWNGLPLALRS